jgi:mono/diheme cytochrome c family protein
MDASSGAVTDAGGAGGDAAVNDARAGARTGGRTGTGTTAAGAGGGGGNVANGRAAFQRTCNRCHPNGEEDTGPRINNINWAEARMRTQVRQGSGGMRPIPVSRLSDADLTDLLAYLRTTHAVR